MSEDDLAADHHRVEAARRHEERVTPLELFFDLVFVLAITQCTALMVSDPTWGGLAEGLLVLGVLWWTWVGYAWLTSVVDPEEGVVRIAIFAAMAALLVAALCVPEAFGDLGLTFAVAYGAVRMAHIALFVLASRHDRDLRRSVIGLAVSTLIGVTLVVAASFLDGSAQGTLWASALLFDMAGPLLFGAEGWTLVPGHFAERHGLIILIALGESIVAIGVGAQAGVDGGIVAAAVVAIALAGGLWWSYFDVLASLVADHLGQVNPGREQNELARDAYSFLHYPMVAGIVLVALGLETTLAHVADPLDRVPAVALLGGIAVYLLSQVLFAWRDHRGVKTERIVASAAVLGLLLVSAEVSALATLSLASAVVAALIAYETITHADARLEIRRAHSAAGGA